MHHASVAREDLSTDDAEDHRRVPAGWKALLLLKDLKVKKLFVVLAAIVVTLTPVAASSQMLPGGNVNPVWCNSNPEACICRKVGRRQICTPNYLNDYWM